MNLVKTSFYTLLSTVFKMLSALVINKAVAYFVGPSGLALVGQFQNFTQLAMTAAQGGINTGVVKYTSEYQNDEIKLTGLFSTALIISLVSSIVTGTLLVVFGELASTHFLNTPNYQLIFVLFGITITLFSLNGLLLSILNGLSEIKIFVRANIIQSIYSLIFTSIFVLYWGINGALFAMATNQSLIFFVLLFLLRKHPILKINNFRKTFMPQEAKKLFKFSVMTIISAIITPISLIIIRNLLTKQFGITVAGQWQAIWYISAMYLLVVTTTLSVYYLPKLSAIDNNILLRKEIFGGYKIIAPVVLLTIVMIFISKGLILQVLFSKEFASTKDLFLFQLIGDFFKMMAWLLSYIMLAKAMAKTFVITEIVFVSTFVLFAYIFTQKYGIVGITYAYALNYLLYFICMIFVFRKLIFSKSYSQTI